MPDQDCLDSAQGAKHWADVGEVGVLWGMRLLLGIYRLGGRWPFRMVLLPVVSYYWLSNGRARRASKAYLARIARIEGDSARSSLSHFLAFGDAMLDKLLASSGELRADQVLVENGELMDRLIARGRGGLLLTAHWGNLELARAAGGIRADLKLNVLVHTRHAIRFNAMLNQLRPSSPVHFIEVTEFDASTAMQLSERVERGEWIAMAADRIPVSVSPRVIEAPFLGGIAPFPVGPFILASLLRCPVVLVHCAKVEHRYGLFYQAFRDGVILPRRDRDAALRELASDYACRLQAMILRAPLQWFNFFDFWQLPEQCEAAQAPTQVLQTGALK